MLCKRFYITIIFLLSLFAQVFAVCTASFHFHETGNLEISFINESSSFDEGTIHYYWDFGDGSTSYEANPVYTYTNPGIYQVSLSLITSELCYDRTIREIHVGIPPTSPYCFLEIHFETTNATAPGYDDGTAYVYGFSDVPCCYYAFWSNDMEGEYITNLEPGTYCVTLTNGEECFGTNCVTIGYNNNCTSSFLVDSLTFSHLEGAYRFINNSHGEAESYHWDFGDGEELSAHSPLHIYDEPGTYNVCLEIHTFYNCVDVFCKEITISNTYPLVSNLYGTVNAGENPLPQGVAVLYQIENNTFSAIRHAIIQDGEYIFNELSKDFLYTTHVIPYFNTEETYFPKYVATYNSNTTYWQDNSYINLYSDTAYHTQLYSYEEVYFDEGLISGQVFYTDLTSYEEAVFAQSWILPITPQANLASNIVVLLKNENHQILDFRLTDSNGEYTFDDLEYGDYYLSVEKGGIPSDEIFVSIFENTSDNSNNNFNISPSRISSTPTNTILNQISLYPNPCTDIIKLEQIPNSIEKIELLNSEGKVIEDFFEIDTKLQIHTSSLLSGIYAIVFYSKDNVLVKTFIKI